VKEKFVNYFARVAEETAKLSVARKLKVGAVIVKDNRILSIGYNGTPSGWDNECENPQYEVGEHEPEITYKTKEEVLHAEANALMKLTQSTDSSLGAEMFVTHVPCIECAKLIYQAGIKKITYINEYEASKGSGLEFLKMAGVEVCPLK
jgi:dCMP deaminase